MPSVLKLADEAVNGERAQSYGHPADDFSRTARMWSAILGLAITAEQVGLCMICVKLSRECNLHKTDNLTDIAGYAECIQKIRDYMDELHKGDPQ